MLKISTLVNKVSSIKDRYNLETKWILDILEFLAILILIPVSHIVTSHILSYQNIPWEIHYGQSALYAALYTLSWYVLAQVTTMAQLPRVQRYLNAAFLFARGFFFIFAVMLLIKYTFNLTAIPVLLILVTVAMSFTITLVMRIFTLRSLRVYRANGYNLRNVLIVGDDCSAMIINKFLEQKDWGFNIRAIISRSPVIKRKYGREIPIVPGTENIEYILESQVIDEVFYCRKNIQETELRKIINVCNEIGVVFRVQSSFSSLEPFEVQMRTLSQANQSLVDVPARSLSFNIKTISDIVFSSIALILLSPVFLLIAAIIKIDSKGPVFYKQERVGLRGRKFMLYKFRTMIPDADKKLKELMAKNEMDGPTFKMRNDPRITRLGRIMRKTGIDEFPQLINVIKGEMSLIGPRPPIEAEVKQYERWQLRRLSVKPGITCTWQIMPDRNDIKFDKWMLMDLNYIDNWSLSKDFKLYFKTITAMLLASGR